MVLASGIFAQAGAANAGGLYVGDNGSQASQRAGAFVAKADDATALAYNPAGLAAVRRAEMFIGVSVLTMDASFQRDGGYQADLAADYAGQEYPEVRNVGGPRTIPMISVAIPLGSRATIAAGFFAPHSYGGGDYPAEIVTATGARAPAPQRYDIVDFGGIAGLPSLAMGYQLTDNLRLGARASWAFASVSTTTYIQGLANDEEDPGLDTVVRLKASDPFIPAFGLGVHYAIGDVELGLAYASSMAVEGRGVARVELGDTLVSVGGAGNPVMVVPVPDAEALCATGGTVDALKACVSSKLPQAASFGARYVSRDENGEEVGDLEIDFRWENWAAAGRTLATIDGAITLTGGALGTSDFSKPYRDSYSVRLGSSRLFQVGSASSLTARAGIGYESAVTPIGHNRLETDTAPRFTFATGVGYAFSRWRLDLGLAYVDSLRRTVHEIAIDPSTPKQDRVQPDIPIGVGGENPPVNPFNSGIYDRTYLIGSLGITAFF